LLLHRAQTINAAVGESGWLSGANDAKLIAALCTRTKSQLQRTRKQ